MYEISINDTAYQFHFGIGFMNKINQTVKANVQGMGGVTKPMGFLYHVANLVDGDATSLEEILFLGNEGQSPRLTRGAIEAWIDDPNTDIEAEIQKVLDFLSTQNACRKQVQAILNETQK